MKFSPLLWPTTSTAAPDAVDEAGAAVSCYFANGDLAEGYRACDVDSPVSSCCPSGYTCSGNALCVLTAPSSLEQPELLPETVSRGACTEPLWNGRYCGGKCLGKTARPPPCCTTLPPVSTQHRCPPRCGGVAQEEQSPFLTCSATQTRKMRQGEQQTVTQSATAGGSGIVAQAVTRREAASARVTSPRWSLWERRERPRRSSAGGQQPLFQEQLRIQLGLSKPGSITLPRRLLRVL